MDRENWSLTLVFFEIYLFFLSSTPGPGMKLAGKRCVTESDLADEIAAHKQSLQARIVAVQMLLDGDADVLALRSSAIAHEIADIQMASQVLLDRQHRT